MSVTLVRSACPTIQRRQTGDRASGRLPSTAALGGKNLQQTFQLPPFNQDTHCLLEVGPEHWWDNSSFNDKNGSLCWGNQFAYFVIQLTA